MTLGLTIDRLIKATPERLYAVWTDSKHLTRWFGVQVDADARIGGEIAIHFWAAEKPPLTGRYTHLRPHDLVAFTWRSEEVDTRVTVTFQAEGAMTRLTLKHEGFASAKDCESHAEGWHEYFELWEMMNNVGPTDGFRAQVAGFLPEGADVPATLGAWFGQDPAQFRKAPDEQGIHRFQNGRIAAQWQATRFGVSLAVAQWGLASEAERSALKKTFLERFKDSGGHA